MKIPFKSVLAKVKDIEKRNALFNHLTNEDKRKEAAFDALNLILNGPLKASKNGEYWGRGFKSKIRKLKTPEELQCFLNEKLNSCKVCQRGLMMISLIRLGNTISPKDCDIDSGNKANIRGFSIKSFEEMEISYEGWDWREKPYSNNTEQTLINNCCNVIANGDFNVDDNTDYLTLWKIKVPTSIKTIK